MLIWYANIPEETGYYLIRKDGGWLIAKKKTILQNDYIPTMLDVYCI